MHSECNGKRPGIYVTRYVTRTGKMGGFVRIKANFDFFGTH
jgi:hypothetical protein